MSGIKPAALHQHLKPEAHEVAMPPMHLCTVFTQNSSSSMHGSSSTYSTKMCVPDVHTLNMRSLDQLEELRVCNCVLRRLKMSLVTVWESEA